MSVGKEVTAGSAGSAGFPVSLLKSFEKSIFRKFLESPPNPPNPLKNAPLPGFLVGGVGPARRGLTRARRPRPADKRRAVLLDALEQTGNVTLAAEFAGLSRRAVYRMMVRDGLFRRDVELATSLAAEELLHARIEADLEDDCKVLAPLMVYDWRHPPVGDGDWFRSWLADQQPAFRRRLRDLMRYRPEPDLPSREESVYLLRTLRPRCGKAGAA